MSAYEGPERRRPPEDTIRSLLGAVEGFTVEAGELRREVKVIEARQTQDRKVNRSLRNLTYLLLVVMLLNVGIAIINKNNGETIRSCTTPGGECYRRNAVVTGAVIQSVSDRTEKERLITEIKVAEATGAGVAVDTRKQRLQEVEEAIRQSDESLANARK